MSSASDSVDRAIHLENRHAGERLSLRRVKRGSEEWLELKGSLPPRRKGPPMHIHFAEDEEGQIRAGTLSVMLNGRHLSVKAGGTTSIPRGVPHRWWNEGDQLLEFDASPEWSTTSRRS